MALSKMDQLQLGWLARRAKPMWGGHLKRGEPISDPDMRRWVETGLIKAIGTEGYVLTEAGRREVADGQ